MTSEVKRHDFPGVSSYTSPDVTSRRPFLIFPANRVLLGGVARDNADAAMALVREAIRGRQALDNVSAVVVMLGW